MFESIGNISAIFKQAQQLGGKLGELTEELRRRRATGSAGGGMVEIEVNGLSEVVACRIDPSLFAQQDRELVEDLVQAAANQALFKGKQLHADAMKALAGDFNIPGLDQALSKLAGKDPTDR